MLPQGASLRERPSGNSINSGFQELAEGFSFLAGISAAQYV